MEKTRNMTAGKEKQPQRQEPENGTPSSAWTKPETGRTYTGEIVAADKTHVYQRNNDGGNIVGHDRSQLSGLKDAQLESGAKLEIRYPYDRVGIVKETPGRELQVKEIRSKGLER